MGMGRVEMMNIDRVDEGEDVGNGLGGDEGGWLVLGRGNGRENSVQKFRDHHVLGRNYLKKGSYPWNWRGQRTGGSTGC